MIGTRLADDLSTGRLFENQNEFEQWETQFTARHNKAPVRYKALLKNAENGAQQIYTAAKTYKDNEESYQAFIEGLQYGYHAAGGWAKDVKRDEPCTRDIMQRLFERDRLSGSHEDAASWKQSLQNDTARAAGKSGYSAGTNLKKNVNATVSSPQELADYFTVFALEYYSVGQQSIGSAISDLRDVFGSNVYATPSSELSQAVKSITDRMLVFYKTHTLLEYQAFLRGVNIGYKEGPASSAPVKRQSSSSSSTASEKRTRIESLLTDMEDSKYSQHDPQEHMDANLVGQSLGRELAAIVAKNNKELVFKLLSDYYDENMKRFSQTQRYPIYAKNNSALNRIFSTTDVNLLAPLEHDEFDRVFPQVENTIDNSTYSDTFEMPTWNYMGANESDVLKKIFASRYGVYSLNRSDLSIQKIVSMIFDNTRGVKTVESLNINPDLFEPIERYALSKEITPLDDDYTPTPMQYELNTIQACEFFVKSSILLAEQVDRDVITVIFTPMLVNVMADYVQHTTSLNKILKVYPERAPLDPEVRFFLSQYVHELNERWFARRADITYSIMYLNTFMSVITDSVAADVALYLKNKTLASKRALINRISSSYDDFDAEDVQTDISKREYIEMAASLGKQNYLRSGTRSLFAWRQLNTESFWPTTICEIQRIVHDVVMIKYLYEEMNQRAAMLENVLFFTEPRRFLRWDMTNYLAQKEKRIDDAREYVEFSSTVGNYTDLLVSSPNSDYSEASEGERTPDIILSPTHYYSAATSSVVNVSDDDDDDSDMDGGTAKYHSRFKTGPPTFRERQIAASSSSMVGDRVGTSNDMSIVLAARKNNIVLREVSALDAGLSAVKGENMHYIGAYHSHAFGAKLGAIAYSPVSKKIVAMETTPGNEKTIGALLVSHVNELFPGTNIGDSATTLEFDEVVVPKITLHDLIIDATINYRPNLAGGTHENPHGIYFYLSRSFSVSDPIFVSADDAMAGKRLQMTYKVKYPEIRGHAMLNVDSYAEVVDVTSDKCVNQSGYAARRLADVVQCKSSKFFLKVPNSDSQLCKGDVMITVHSVSLPVRPHATVTTKKEWKIDHAASQKLVKQYINANRAFYRKHPNIVSSVQNITVFEYAGREGIIPGSMFDVFKLAPSKEPYFTQVLGFAIQHRRPDIDITSYDLNDWVKLDEKVKVCILMDVIRMYVNYCPYIRDMADNNTFGGKWSCANIELIESFDYIRQRDAGDCEDFSREMLQTVMEIKYNLRNSQSAAIQELRRLAEMFIFASILCGVSREAMSLKELSKGNVELHGHECAVAIPNYIFFEALRRNNSQHPIFKLYTPEEQTAGVGQQIYILEGTGCLFPEPRDKTPHYAEIEAAFNKERVFSGIVDPMIFYHPNRDTGFYKQMISILTPELFLKTGYLGFEFLMCQKHDKGIFRGVPFSLLLDIYAHQDIQIIQAPDMSPEVFRAASRIDDDNFPPIAFTPGSITQDMRNVCATLTTGRPRPGQDVFQFQVKFAQMTPELVTKISQFAQTHRWNVLCVAEPLKLSFSTGDNVGGYFIFIF